MGCALCLVGHSSCSLTDSDAESTTSARAPACTTLRGSGRTCSWCLVWLRGRRSSNSRRRPSGEEGSSGRREEQGKSIAAAAWHHRQQPAARGRGRAVVGRGGWEARRCRGGMILCVAPFLVSLVVGRPELPPPPRVLSFGAQQQRAAMCKRGSEKHHDGGGAA